MSKFEGRGEEVRALAKKLVLDYMASVKECKPGGKGVRQAQIFKECGFDWGNQKIATSTNQQYWVAAILWDLKSEGKVERVSESGPWRLAEPS